MSIKREVPDKQWLRSIYVLITKFHWDMTEIKQLPLSTLGEIYELLEWEQKETEKERRRNQQKRK